METINLQIIVGLLVGIVFLIYMIMKTKIHTFLALIIDTIIVGIIGHIPYNQIINSIIKGFGQTLGSIGIIIGFGVIMGQLFEISGAARKMALCFLRLFGKGREELAMAITGFLVSIPIFCDSGFIILTPLIKAISKETKKSIVSLGLSLAGGLVITHSLVPPTPGPVGVAGIFNISVGSLVLWGILVAIPMLIGVILYAKYIGNHIWQIPDNSEGWTRNKNYNFLTSKNYTVAEENLPNAFISFAPIIIPIILILLKTISETLHLQGSCIEFIKFLGTPVIATGIGLLITIYGLTSKLDRKEVIKEAEEGIKFAGSIILITGAGGAFGMLIRESGIGKDIANLLVNSSVPPILLPFIISTLIRFVQGSGTVAMLTTASITAPVLINLSVNPIFATLATCIGSLFFSYFNDSFFWVINRSIGLSDGKEQLKAYSITSTIAWGIGIIVLLILNIIFK